MSLPEISRRCLSCGAAVRAGSRFCQQCGKGLEAEAQPGASGGLEEARARVPPTGELALPPEAPTPVNEPTPTKDWTPPTKEFAAFEQSSGAAAAQAVPPPEQMPAAVAAAVEPEPDEVSTPQLHEEAGPASEEADEDVDAGRADDLRGRVARVREGTRARVGRMREEAIVVLEETPDDSGLRFVLVAAALFVVFIVLLFLSTTVLR
ncbi:MAG: zinc ribbon domain-containing protein [Pyrinomonadaceae bacterium]